VADVYFSRYDAIFDGRLLDVQPSYRRGALQGQNSERCGSASRGLALISP
jgi:hypothetical protein